MNEITGFCHCYSSPAQPAVVGAVNSPVVEQRSCRAFYRKIGLLIEYVNRSGLYHNALMRKTIVDRLKQARDWIAAKPWIDSWR
jgi:hypothetical protein